MLFRGLWPGWEAQWLKGRLRKAQGLVHISTAILCNPR